MTESEELREAWRQQLAEQMEAQLKALKRERNPSLRGNHVASILEAVGGLALLGQLPARLQQRAVEALDAEALADWEAGLRIERVVSRYRHQVVAVPDSIVLGEDRSPAARRPSPAVTLFETRQALHQQSIALRELDKQEESAGFTARLESLDRSLRQEFVTLLGFDDFEPARAATLELAYLGDPSKAPWWCTYLEGLSFADLAAAVQFGLESVPARVRDAILADEHVSDAFLELHELLDLADERVADRADDRLQQAMALRWLSVDQVLQRMDDQVQLWEQQPAQQRPRMLVAQAAGTAVGVGRARVVVLLPDRSCALVEVGLSYAEGVVDGDPFAAVPFLESDARSAVRDAFIAACACSPSGLPPAPFEAHRLELDLGEHPIDAVDGRSLGLPVALAFLSAWAGTALPNDVVATGYVSHDGKVHPVGELKAKALAVAAWQSNARFLFAGELEPRDALRLEEVKQLQGAASSVGIDTNSLSDEVWLGDIAGRRLALDNLCTDVLTQNLSSFAASNRPWESLADRMRLLINSLESSADAETKRVLGKARSLAALAYLHVGAELSAIDELLGAEPEAPFARALRLIVQLSKRIDDLGQDEATDVSVRQDMRSLEAKLHAELQALLPGDRELLEGQAFGTIGRSYLHRGDSVTALRWLEQARDSHAAQQRHELPRSRIYVAMALRRLGRPDEAATTLMAARAELSLLTKPYSAHLATTTGVFLEYELARSLLDQGRSADATTVCRHALEQARRAAMGTWPRQGLLRTLIWARKERGQDVQELLSELEEVTGGFHVFRRILDEARGPKLPPGEGEVY